MSKNKTEEQHILLTECRKVVHRPKRSPGINSDYPLKECMVICTVVLRATSVINWYAKSEMSSYSQDKVWDRFTKQSHHKCTLHHLNPFTAPTSKIRAYKQYIFWSYNTSTCNAVRFDDFFFFTCQCEKRRQKGLKGFRFCTCIGSFK